MYAWTRLIKGQHVVGPLIENRLWTYTVLIWTFFLVLVWGTHYWLCPGIVYTQFDVVFDTKSLEPLWSAWSHQPPLQDAHTSWHQDLSRRARAWLTLHSEVRAHQFWKLILWFISSHSDRLQVMQLATFLRQHEHRHCSEIQMLTNTSG